MSSDRAVLNAVRDAIFLADFDTGMIMDANRAAEALCGRSLSQLRSLCYTQLSPPHQEFLRLGAGKDADVPVLTEGVILHQDGHRIPVEITCSHFTDSDGKRVWIGVFRDVTGGSAAREALRQSEERFRQVAEIAGEFIWELDADGFYLYASPVVEQILGYTPGELVGKMHPYDLLVPETRAEMQAAASEIMGRQEPFRAFLTWRLRKDGRLVALETSGAPFRDASGKFLGYRGASRDVTERIRAEEALRQSEKIYRAIGESIDYGVWVCAPDGRNTYASESFLRLVGLTQEQCSSFGWGDVLHPDDAQRTIAAWKECVRTEGRWDIEHRFRGVDGKWHSLLARGVPVRDEEGRITCWAGINLDIGGLKRAQERLRESESQAHARAAELQAIMEAAPAAIFIAHDPECRHISGNHTAHAMLREQRDSNLSKSAPDHELPVHFRVVRDGVEIPPEELPIQRAVRTGQPVRNCEVEVVFEDGASTHLMGNVEPLLDDNGRPRGAVAVLSDISERKREELELRKFASLADNSVEFIGMCDMNFMPFYVNQAGLRLVGLDSLEQAVRTPVAEFFFPEEQRFIIEEFFPRVIREGRAEVEIRFRHFRTGNPLWMIYNVFYIKGAAGQPVGLATVSRDITARKQAEAALRESEERFRNMADTAPVLLWVSGTDKLCTFFNRPWLDFTGRTLEQELGNGWADGVHPEDFDRCLAIYSSSFEARRTFQMEYRLRRADGQYRWVLDHGTPRYHKGEFTGFIGSCIDVTEQKLIEERLRANEVQLKEAQRLAKVGSWEFHLQTGSNQWSDEMRRIIGFTNGPPPDFSAFLSCVHAKDRERLVQADTRLRASLSPLDLEYRIIRPDGGLRFVRSVAEGIVNEQGSVVRIVGATQDITEQVEARELLRESENRLKNAERLAHVGHWQWDLQANVVSWSDETYRIFGKSPGYTPSYQGLQEAIVPTDKERVDRWVRECIAEKKGNSLEFQVIRSDGTLRTIATVSEVLLGEDGLPVRLFGACQDITDRKQIEEMLRDSEQQLRALAGSLLTAQEDERRRLSRELHDDVTQRLAFLSFELGNLAAKTPELAEETQTSVRALQEQTLQLSGEVRRLAHGLHPSAIEDFGLSIALEEFCHQFEVAKGINVRFDGFIEDTQLDTVEATCLYRVAQESLRNAVVHGRATEIRVELTADAGSIHLRVQDNGTGFSGGDAGTKTGLGLISMRERIRFVHGKLTISSQLGQGTEITASVPLEGAGDEARAHSAR